MGAYKQIRAQEVPVLSDVNEDNFDRAFDIIRPGRQCFLIILHFDGSIFPVIQGTADASKKLTEDEVQKTMDFCKNIFAPTDPEMHEVIGARLPELTSATAPIMSEQDIEKVVDPEDEDAKHVLSEINARKPIHAMYSGPAHIAMEGVNGLVGRVEWGSLGLIRV
jgi:hypothetical protein